MDPEASLALELAKDLDPSVQSLERLSQRVGRGTASWALSQWSLRRKARKKFKLADEMLFDKDGLEMASHEVVAAYHASKFEPGELVVDLCCGIGADLISLARRGPVIGLDINPKRIELARHNLAVHGLEADLRVGDAYHERFEADAYFIDPQRRNTKCDHEEPSPQAMRGTTYYCRRAVMKMGTDWIVMGLQEIIGPAVEAISFEGECRELLVLAGREVQESACAVHVESGSRLEPSGPPPSTPEPSAYLFHADPAAIKIGALGALCTQHGLEALGDSDGYLTGSKPIESPWLRAYRVVWHGRSDRKATQAALRELEASVFEVKTRGIPDSAEAIRKAYKPSGDRRLSLAVWTVGPSRRHALLEALPKNP